MVEIGLKGSLKPGGYRLPSFSAFLPLAIKFLNKPVRLFTEPYVTLTNRPHNPKVTISNTYPYVWVIWDAIKDTSFLRFHLQYVLLF